MDKAPEIVTNARALVFGLGLTVLAAAFGAHTAGWQHWITIGMLYAAGVSLIAGAVWQCAHAYYALRFAAPLAPLEIIFEPLNPARRFWSMESRVDQNGRLVATYWEHRVEVRNTSQKTLRNVVVTIERVGEFPEKPYAAEFTRTNETRCDLQPHCGELVTVLRWPIPKISVGMLAGPSAWGYGPIKIVVSADDVVPAERLFDFNYLTEQMLFHKEQL